MRHDIPDVVRLFVKNNRVRMVTIPTNGSLTDQTVAVVEQLVTEFPDVTFRIPLSLDGYPEDHDHIRAKGSFDKLEATARALDRIRARADNLVVDINTCFSSVNEGKLGGFADFVADRFDVDNHTITYVRGNADEKTKNASADEYVRLSESMRQKRTPREARPFSSLLRAVTEYQRDIIRKTLRHDRMYVPCAAGRKMIVINERGEVMPCEILNKTLGNLKDHDYDVAALLKTHKSDELVGWIRKTKCHCTFECALATSIIHHWGSYPRVFWRAMTIWWRRRPRNRAAYGEQPTPGPSGTLVPLRVGGKST